jgi:hypothetical protein
MAALEEITARKSAATEAANTGCTRGPWSVGDGGVVALKATDDGNVVCLPPSDDMELSLARWEDNARLIAAAPELLAALKRALPILMVADDNLPSINERIAQAEAALRKAEGL